MLPLTNKLLLNPSFAGWDKKTTVQTGDYFMTETEADLNHVFYLTYDTYSEKLKGGLGYYFYQDLYGSQNINETGLGFTYSKPLSRGKGKRIIPSLNLNYKLATKQWFVQMMEPQIPPGKELLRYNVFLPRAGILWDSPDWQIGLSGAYFLHIGISEEGEPPPDNSPEIIVYISKLMDGKQKGLTSMPYEFVPEVIFSYSGNTFLTRSGFQVSSVKHNYGLFIQNNYSSNLHGAGGVFGWNFSRFKVNLVAGSAFHFDTEKIAFFGEVSLALKLPYSYFDQKNPWATPKKLF